MPDDAFKNATRDVTPLRHKPTRRLGRVRTPTPPASHGTPPAPLTQSSPLPGFTVRVVDEEGPIVCGYRDGGGQGPLKTLLKGKAKAEATIDLHGLSSGVVTRQLPRKLEEKRLSGMTTVLVIHGKGHHSKGGEGVLGPLVHRLLISAPAARITLAFHTADRTRGGHGATLVKLKKAKP